MNNQKILGIIGGMGPMATIDLYAKIISMTKADRDQNHIHTLIDSATTTPDRCACILDGGESPLPYLVAAARRLEAAGAGVLIMACNTAHYFYDGIAESVAIPLLHMPRETALAIKRRGIEKVGLLATDGTLQTGIYHRALQAQGIEVITPDDKGQKRVMELIYDGVKAGDYSLNVVPLLRDLADLQTRGADIFVLGCTELPIAFERYSIPFTSVDPTRVLAAGAIRAAGYALNED